MKISVRFDDEVDKKAFDFFLIIHIPNQNQEKMAEEKHHNERQNEFTQYTTKPSKCF